MIYRFLKQIVKLALFFFFRKIELSGKINTPSKGPVIFVANHPNTLMDPLLVAAIVKQRVGFVANASIFVNSLVSSVFKYLHVIPIFRREDVKAGEKPDNRKSFEKCHEYLTNNGSLLIFPEGTSHYELKLREIKTGTARIALSYEDLKGYNGKLKIVPIALDYSDAIHFRSAVSVTICKAIEVVDYRKQYEGNEHEAIVQLTEDIRKELAEIVPQTSGKEQENFLVKAHQFYTTFYSPKASLDKNPKQSLELRTQVSKALQFLKKRNLELYLDTQMKLLLFSKILKEEKINPAVVASRKTNKYIILETTALFILFLVLFPLYVIGLLFNYIPYIIPARVFKSLNLDIEYRASVQMLVGLFSFPLYYALTITLFIVFVSSNLWLVLLLLILMPLMGYISMSYYAALNKFVQLLRFRFLMSQSKKSEIENLIIDILKNIEVARKNLIV